MAITGSSVARLCPTAQAAFPSPSTRQQRSRLPALDDSTITSLAEAEQPGNGPGTDMDCEGSLEALTEGTIEKKPLSYLLRSLCEERGE